MDGPRPSPPRRAATVEGRAIVAAILDASEALLFEDGIARLTTNRIANRAGVSVGSLYQYFENKEAIVAAAGRRFDQRRLIRLRSALTGLTEPGVEPAIRALIRAAAEHEAHEGDARAALSREVPASWIQADRATVRWLTYVIARFVPEVERPDVVAFVAYHGVVNALEAIRRETASRWTEEAVLRDLEHLVWPLFKDAMSR